MNPELEKIISYLYLQGASDFSGSRSSVVERRIENRMMNTANKNIDDYFDYLKNNPEEVKVLIDTLTINYSCFFRNPLTFEFLAHYILPPLITEKIRNSDHDLRIWSAGCSSGEEAYSIAIIIKALLKNMKDSITLHIFATDIDQKVLEKAQQGVYNYESVKNVKYHYITEYFNKKQNLYHLHDEIKRMVNFSSYDLLSKNATPPESIFGGFDLVFCRNVLIYFNKEFQNNIFRKLSDSLNSKGYLVLGESENPVWLFENNFSRLNYCCDVYQKRN